jgi:hypothetical protein
MTRPKVDKIAVICYNDPMPKLTEKLQKSRDYLQRGLAATALTGVAVLAPAPASAEPVKSEKLARPMSVKAAEQRATADLNHRRPLMWANGGLLFLQKVKNGGVEATQTTNGGTRYSPGISTVTRYVDKPIVYFRGNPKERFGHNDLNNGDYVFMEITDRESTHPKLKAIKRDNTSHLISNLNGEPFLQSVTFMERTEFGGIDLNSPAGGYDLDGMKGGPLQNEDGSNMQIAIELSPQG